MGTWFRAQSPKTRIIGVVAAGAPAMARSWRTERVESTARVHTIADGIAIRAPIPEAVSDVQPLIDEYLEIPDEQIIQAMRWLYEDTGLLVEPAGAVGIAAIAAVAPDSAALVATPLCGSNLTDAQIRHWILDGGVSESERK
jgi:threonine dehydratase